MCAMLRCPTMRSSDAKRIQTDTPSNEQMARELCCCPCVYAHTLPAVANNTQGTRECVWMCVVDVAMSATLLPHRGVRRIYCRRVDEKALCHTGWDCCVLFIATSVPSSTLRRFRPIALDGWQWVFCIFVLTKRKYLHWHSCMDARWSEEHGWASASVCVYLALLASITGHIQCRPMHVHGPLGCVRVQWCPSVMANIDMALALRPRNGVPFRRPYTWMPNRSLTSLCADTGLRSVSWIMYRIIVLGWGFTPNGSLAGAEVWCEHKLPAKLMFIIVCDKFGRA